MIETVSKKLVDFIVRESSKKDNDREIIEYGMILLISDVINNIVVIAIGFLFGKVLCSLVFFVSFALMREQTGGYHAKTHLGCNLVLGINTALVMTAVRFFGNNLKIAWGVFAAAAVFGLITFMLLAPREHENKKLEQYSKDILKKRSIIVWLIISVVQLVLLLCGRTEYAVSVGLSMISVADALYV